MDKKALDSYGIRARKNWFDRKFKKFGALADENGFIQYSSNIIGIDPNSEDVAIKFEKILEAQLYASGLKMRHINGRLKGFWIK